MKITNKYPYCIGHINPLSKNDITALIKFFAEDPLEEYSILGGRGKVVITKFEDNQPVVVKFYKRGGFIRHFIKQSYFRSGKTRPRIEFEMLQKVRSFGISAPEPIAWASCGGLFYRGLLVTKKIENSASLADYCSAEPGRIDDILTMLIKQMKLLIQNRIMHVDLHPGNILFDGKKVYIIDFDKSSLTSRNTESLTDFYVKRWKRAVKKHHLPNKIATIFEEKLKLESH